MDKLKKGDIVRLIIGSRKMVVSSVYGKGLVECISELTDGEMKTFYFRPESLVRCGTMEEIIQ